MVGWYVAIIGSRKGGDEVYLPYYGPNGKRPNLSSSVRVVAYVENVSDELVHGRGLGTNRPSLLAPLICGLQFGEIDNAQSALEDRIEDLSAVKA